MLEQIDYELISYLFNWKERSIEKVSSVLGASKDEIKNSIHRINEHLNSPIYVENRDSKDYILLIDRYTDEIYKRNDINMNMLIQYLSIKNRHAIIVLYLLTNNHYISLLEIAELIDVSKNTVLNDINTLKNELKYNKVNINYDRKFGYKIVGNEFTLRKLINEHIARLLKVPIGKYLLSELEIVKLEEKYLLPE